MKKLLILMMAVMLIALPCLSEDLNAVQVSSPNGAPGLALAAMAVKAPEQYHYVAAETITAEFASAQSDFIIAPINVGAKLYKAGKSSYKLAAVVTWGNLYFASQRPDFTVDSLNGAELTLFGENTINAVVANYTLDQLGIKPASVQYLAGAANTQSLLLTDANAIVLTAEPALTAAKMKSSAISAISLNELYQQAAGTDNAGYPQAGLFVSRAAIEQHPDLVAAYLGQAETAVKQCETDVQAVAEAAVALELLPNLKVAVKAIPGCAIHFVSSAEARAEIEKVAQLDLSQFGGALPSDDFYYVP